MTVHRAAEDTDRRHLKISGSISGFSRAETMRPLPIGFMTLSRPEAVAGTDLYCEIASFATGEGNSVFIGYGLTTMRTGLPSFERNRSTPRATSSRGTTWETERDRSSRPEATRRTRPVMSRGS